MVPNWFLDNLQPFLIKPFFDQVPNKGFVLLDAGQFATRLQEFRLRGSYLDGSWQAMPSITTFLKESRINTIYDNTGYLMANWTKVIWLCWGYRLRFVLTFWVLCIYEKGTFMPRSSVFIKLMLRAIYGSISKHLLFLMNFELFWLLGAFFK